MTVSELAKFVVELDASPAFEINTVMEVLKVLPQKHHELFMMLVNHKNGSEFTKKLENGEI